MKFYFDLEALLKLTCIIKRFILLLHEKTKKELILKNSHVK